MKAYKGRAVVVLTAAVFTLALAACQKEEGPAEKAGKEIDKALSRAGEQLQQAGRDIQSAAE